MRLTQILKQPEVVITFPRLRELKGKHRVTYEKLSNVIGSKAHSTAKIKIDSGHFHLVEMICIVDFFNALGESETVESLFVSWITQIRKFESDSE